MKISQTHISRAIAQMDRRYASFELFDDYDNGQFSIRWRNARWLFGTMIADNNEIVGWGDEWPEFEKNLEIAVNAGMPDGMGAKYYYADYNWDNELEVYFTTHEVEKAISGWMRISTAAKIVGKRPQSIHGAIKRGKITKNDRGLVNIDQVREWAGE